MLLVQKCGHKVNSPPHCCIALTVIKALAITNGVSRGFQVILNLLFFLKKIDFTRFSSVMSRCHMIKN